jgi:hypothetical protein
MVLNVGKIGDTCERRGRGGSNVVDLRCPVDFLTFKSSTAAWHDSK